MIKIVETCIMKRKIYNRMLQWKQTKDGSTALLIEGARRIGKSYIAVEFARNEYDSYILIDFSKAPARVKNWFDEYLEELGDERSGHVLYLMVQDQGSEETNIRFEQEVKELLRGAEIGNLWLVFVCFTEEDFEVLDFSTPLYSLQEVYTYRSNKNLYDE